MRRLRRAAQEAFSGEALHAEMQRMLETDLYRLPQGEQFLLYIKTIVNFSNNFIQDFFGDEYKSHNACMSEDQRYSKEGRSGWDPTQGSVRKKNTTIKKEGSSQCNVSFKLHISSPVQFQYLIVNIFKGWSAMRFKFPAPPKNISMSSR